MGRCDEGCCGCPERMWVNQPSTLQPLHHLHGTNVLAIRDSDSGRSSGTMRIYFLSGPIVSQQTFRECLNTTG